MDNTLPGAAQWLWPAVSLALVFGSAALLALWIRARRYAARERAMTAVLTQSIELLPCQFAAFAPDGRLLLHNDTYQDLHKASFASLPRPLTYEAIMRVAVQATHPHEVEAELARRLASHEAADGTPFERLYPDGRWMHVVKKRLPSGVVAGFALDISAAKAAQAQITHLARHDPLTGLGNRAAFQAALAEAASDPAGTTLVLADLDRFKQVNDLHGHAVGDALLAEVAGRMRAAVRPSDTVCRLGGDEFAIVLRGVGGDTAFGLARRLHGAITAPCAIEGSTLDFGCSMGLAFTCAGVREPARLLRHADLALYQAKRSGRSAVLAYSEELGAAEFRAEQLRVELREALLDPGSAGARLHLAWQPQCDIRTRALAGAEALLRFDSPRLGRVSPMELVGAAVAMGRARALDDRVIALALDQATAWLGRPRMPPAIAINVTADSLADPTFPGRLGVALVARGLEAGRIEIEIPEAIAIRDLNAVGPQLAALRAMGVRLALDDFGAGHSSLAHALRLPVQRLKLDRSIVSELPGGARSRAMLRAITALARSMEIELLAEGVETEAQAFALRREGVTLVQGYLYGVPQPASALIAAPALAAAG